jgi:hypothetical protein
MGYQVLDGELARYLLEGEEDELTPLQEERTAKIKRSPCPRCGAALQPQLNTRQIFDVYSPLPRLLSTCECGVEIDPESGIVIDRGKATKVSEPLPIIRPKDD